MPIIIDDEVLKKAGLSEREGLIEIACLLYDRQKLSQAAAAKLAGLSRTEFEDELLKRNMPLIRIDEEYWQRELKSLRELDSPESRDR